MAGISRRPKIESVMMFGRDHDSFHAGFFDDTGPLPAVQGGGIEYIGQLVSVAPFLIGECIRSEMDEGVKLHGMPHHLAFAGHGSVGNRRLRKRWHGK